MNRGALTAAEYERKEVDARLYGRRDMPRIRRVRDADPQELRWAVAGRRTERAGKHAHGRRERAETRARPEQRVCRWCKRVLRPDVVEEACRFLLLDDDARRSPLDLAFQYLVLLD